MLGHVAEGNSASSRQDYERNPQAKSQGRDTPEQHARGNFGSRDSSYEQGIEPEHHYETKKIYVALGTDQQSVLRTQNVCNQ